MRSPERLMVRQDAGARVASAALCLLTGLILGLILGISSRIITSSGGGQRGGALSVISVASFLELEGAGVERNGVMITSHFYSMT
ncbi:hypothetical protein EVAR_37168_1 [Eumeta japonica]|uniref:Uncharacterized protein n=1 Tax=Eumeta variegata TaxID=151549 RepID=A0A4C1WIH4_EUMVA|nr:hypothetical protein EVAR_37168_1 [Eumeta japonica]